MGRGGWKWGRERGGEEEREEGRIISLISIKPLVFIIRIILIISNILQVSIDLGIADHVWQEKRAAIATTIDLLGDKFNPELRAGWLAYIHETYPDGPIAACDIVGEDALVLDG